MEKHRLPDGSATAFRFGVPTTPLDFFGDAAAQKLFEQSIARLESLGGKSVAIDFTPFKETCRLLYGGAWVAERLAAIDKFAEYHSADMLPVTREIILGARPLRAVDVFQGLYRLAELTRRVDAVWRQIDLLLLPTTGTIYRIDEVAADPIKLNSNLGLYTNFTNLLDLSAIAIPAGFRANGLPFGVTLMSRAFADEALAALASRLHRALPQPTIGATGRALPALPTSPKRLCDANSIELAVIGAHLSGGPLNHELTQRGAVLVRTARTARGYSLYALPKMRTPKPGLIFDGVGQGNVEVEIWALPVVAMGSFLAETSPPHVIGTITLADGSSVKGFLCESHAVIDAEDITAFGSWRDYGRHGDLKQTDTGAN